MEENIAGVIFDSLLCYTVVICKSCVKNVQETMKVSRIYELSGQPTGYIFPKEIVCKTGNNEAYRHIIWVRSLFLRGVLKDKACGTQLLI